MNRASFRILFILVLLISQGGLINQPCAWAQLDSSQFRNANKDLGRATDRLVQAVQIFLQTNNRWFPQPQGADMNLCYALHDFKQQVDSLKGGNDRNARTKLEQMSNNLRSIHSLINQVGADASVNIQYETVRGSLQMLASSNNYSPPWDPMPWNPTPGRNPINPFGPQFISARFQAPNYAVVNYRDSIGRNVEATSALDSYTLSFGLLSRPRPAKGDEVQILSAAYAQVRGQGGGGSTPVNVFSRGRGSLMLAGQPPIGLGQVEISSSRWSQDVDILLSPNNGQPPIQMKGKLNNYGRSGFTVNLQGSAIGVMSGTLQANVSFDNNLYSLYGHGMVNGKPFTLDFDR